jgi:hypothetical protein
MKTRKSGLALSILAGGLSFVGSADAGNLLLNSSFETYSGGGDVFGQRGTNDWVGYFSRYNHSATFYDGPDIPASENPGTYYSWRQAADWGMWDNFTTPEDENFFLVNEMYAYALTQTVYLTNAVSTAIVDAGKGRYNFSAWLASYGKPHPDPEQPYLVLRFFDYGTTQLGDNVIFDRTTNRFAVTFADTKNNKGTNVPPDISNNHEWIKFIATNTIPVGARKATVYVTRSPNAAKVGSPDTYVDLVKLDVIDATQTTIFDSSFPVNGQTGVGPDAAVTVSLRDVTTQVNTNSIQFSFDSTVVSPVIQKLADLTTIQYDPPGLMTALSSHTCKVVWSDNGSPVTTKTNQFAFTVAPYVNVNLGTPLYLQTFDGVAEGALPPGWSVQNFTDPDLPGYDLTNFHSDAFTNWTVISYNTLTNWFTVTPNGPDFFGALNVAPNQVINNALVTNLISTNFIIAVSDRAPTKQIDYLFTSDYNLSGKTNVYLSFHNIYVQNQNNIASVEYSINAGATWLPALYMLDGPDILFDSAGNIDASNTLATVYSDVPNVDAGTPTDGYYGRYVGVNSNLWSTLAPFLSARVNDDEVESKRAEIIRLAQADNQPAVRFRMAIAGSYGWYFGIDSFGLYSIASANPPLLGSAPTPSAQMVAIGNTASFTVPNPYGLGPLSFQWRQNGTNLPGKTAQKLVLPNLSFSAAGTYDVVVTGPGGSVTSPPPAAVLTPINPAVFVTGQWDFLNGDLTPTIGAALQYGDATAQTDTTFGTTTSLGIPDINGVPAPVMYFSPSSFPVWWGYQLFPGTAPNGGGTNINQYTLIYDIYYPVGSDGYRSLWQTDTNNALYSSLYIGNVDVGFGIGVGTTYDGVFTDGQWHRLAFAIDLNGPGGQPPVMAKFIDGVKVADQTTDLSPADGWLSVGAYGYLFAEANGDFVPGYVSSVQFSNGRRPDAFIEALGGPSAAKIPGAITVARQGGVPVIRWTGGVPLQSADSLNGPWSTVNGATSPYTPTGGSTAKFYRPKIP